MSIRFLTMIVLVFALAAPLPAKEETLGAKIKKIFATPTPTPRPHKKGTTKKSSASPTPSKKSSPKHEEETPTPSPSSKKKKSSTAEEEETPSPSPSKRKVTPAKEEEEKTPVPSAKKKKTPAKDEELESPSPGTKKKKGSPTATPSPSASPHRKKKGSPTPQPFESSAAEEIPSASLTPEESLSANPTSTPTPTPKKQGAPNATLTPDQIKGFENYPPNVQQLLTSALELTTRNLEYKYGSDDPANGGMDCSGFVYYVLRQNGITDVPRDSSGQYVWLRRARTFEPVISEKEDSFELENLKPGDLLFWTGTYSIERDPPITHAMIYLGREKKTGQRVMVGSSDGRVYQGESRNGVSVFDFRVQRRNKSEDGKLHPTFVGYGHLPGL